MKNPANQNIERAAHGRFATDCPLTRALARKGKRASIWRFGIPGAKKPPRPEWVK